MSVDNFLKIRPIATIRVEMRFYLIPRFWLNKLQNWCLYLLRHLLAGKWRHGRLTAGVFFLFCLSGRFTWRHICPVPRKSKSGEFDFRFFFCRLHRSTHLTRCGSRGNGPFRGLFPRLFFFAIFAITSFNPTRIDSDNLNASNIIGVVFWRIWGFQIFTKGLVL